MFTFTFFSPKVLFGFLYFSIQIHLGKKSKMAPKRGVLESRILSPTSHFQFPQPIPTDTSILSANLPNLFVNAGIFN